MSQDIETLHHDIKSTVMSVKAYTQLILRKNKTSLDKISLNYLNRLDKQIDKLIKQVKKLNNSPQKSSVKNK